MHASTDTAVGPEDLHVQRGRASTLAYEDGIVLVVRVLDPSTFSSADALVAAAKDAGGPRQVALVAGAVPLAWRSALRDADVSFIDVTGVAEIGWPRVRVSARRFGQPVKRRRSALPMQKGHGLVVQELLVHAMDGSQPSIGELTSSAGIRLPTASRAVSQLEAHGLVVKNRVGHRVVVEVVDPVAVAQVLAQATAWPGRETLSGYLWGRTVLDVAGRLCAAADRAGLESAVSGRVGAAYLGVLGTAFPAGVRAWVVVGDRSLNDVAEMLGLEPAPREAANVALSDDRWRIGVHGRRREQLDDLDAWVSHPLRVWCDLHDEQRGLEFAAQLWSVATSGR